MKKLLSIVLTVLMLASVCTSFTGVMAAGSTAQTRLSQASVWDGNVLTVTSADALYTFDGEGTETSPYLIKSASDLAKLAANVNFNNGNTAGKYYKLTCDVNIDSKTWTGIGSSTANKFKGIFDGDGHLVFNLAIKDSQYSGLFGCAGSGAVIKNIGIASGDIFLTNGRASSLLGLAHEDITVSNCFSWANITMNGNGHVGGLIGVMMNAATSVRNIENCYYAGTFKAGTTNSKPHMNYAFGGLVGAYWDGTTNFTNCHFNGVMEITTFTTAVDNAHQHTVGGLAGGLAFAGTTNVNNCSVGGTVTHKNERADFTTYVSGMGHIAGHVQSATHKLNVTNFTSALDMSLISKNTGADAEANPTVTAAITASVGTGYAEDSAKPAITTAETVTVPLATGSKCFMVAVATDINNNLEIGVSKDEAEGPVKEIELPAAPETVPSYTTTNADELARYNAASKWDGTVYTVNSLDEVYKFEGEGTEESPYLLKSADDVAKLAANVRFDNFATNYTDEYFLLTCDLDFQNHGWMGIGGCTTVITWNDNIMFSGIFDGGGHVVYNFNLANTNGEGKQIYYNGFFGYAGTSYCEIKNFGIMNGEIYLGGEGLGPTRTAALIGASRYDIVVNNCFNKANITFVFDGKGEPRVGGIMGAVMNDSKTERHIVDCYNEGDLTLYAKGVTNNCLGGIAGYISDGTGTTIENCYNTGDLKVYTDSTYLPTDGKVRAIGSLVGSFVWKGVYSFKNCVAGGTITYENVNSKYTAPIGSLAGFVSSDSTLSVSGCKYADSLKDYSVVAEYKTGAVITAEKIDSVTIPMSEKSAYFIADVEAFVENIPTEPDDEEDKKDDTSDKSDKNDDETTADTTAEVTDKVAEDEGGCGSAIAAMPVAMVAILGTAVTVIKKRK